MFAFAGLSAKARTCPPFRTQGLGNASDKEVSGLVDEEVQRQRLPAVGMEQVRITRPGGQQRPIHRPVVEVGIIARLIRVIVCSKLQDGLWRCGYPARPENLPPWT